MAGPRVRFAPSPTGVLHVGGARTALFNYLFAKSRGGGLVLRIEDTDRQRSTEAAVEVILDGLAWLGIGEYEGPFFQSRRGDLYRVAIDEMLASGRAYRCACTPDELTEKRAVARKAGGPEGYDRTCRGKDVPADVPHTIRAAFPLTGKTVVNDLLRGEVVFDNAQLDDLIIARTDGSPTYNLTVVVDDAEMGITHVLRGDDHLSNTPKQVQLYELLDKPVPAFAHFPMVLGPDGSKLSKRHGATSILEFREMGILPETMICCLVRLGWSHGDQEIFTLEELERLFDLDKVGKTAAVFDVEKKVLPFNGIYIRQTGTNRLMELLRPHLVAAGLDADAPWLGTGIEALKVRSRSLNEMVDGLVPFFAEEVEFDPKAKKKNLKPAKVEPLPSLADALAGVDPFDAAHLEEAANAWLAENELELKKVGQAIRVSLTGRSVSPPLYDTMEILGREKTLARLRAAPVHAAASPENP